MVVEYEGYLIEQSEDEPEAFVYRGNKRVMHLGLTRFLDSDELIAAFAECLRISGLRREMEKNHVEEGRKINGDYQEWKRFRKELHCCI